MTHTQDDRTRFGSNLGGRMKNLSVTPGFQAVHVLFLVTSVFKGIAGSFMFAEGLNIIPSLTGVVISAMTVWFVIKGWEAHRFTDTSLTVSIFLYGVAMLDEWGNMMAVGIGGGFARGYFGWGLACSIVVLLSLWVTLALFNEEYKEARENIGMSRRESRAARKIQMQIILDRIADKEEKLLKKNLARVGRRAMLMGQHGAIMRRLNSWKVSRKLKKSAEIEVNLLLNQLDIHTDPSKKVTTSSVHWALSGDGAPSLT